LRQLFWNLFLDISEDRGWFNQDSRNFGSSSSSNNQNNNRNNQHRYPPTPQRQNQDSWSSNNSNHQDNEPWSGGYNNSSNNAGSRPFFMLNQMPNSIQQIPKTIYTVNCGEIRPKDDGTRVKISGKVVKRPRTGRFLEIKDIKGCTQLVATDDKPEIGMKFQSVPAEAFVTIIGTVQLRPNNFFNKVSFIISCVCCVIET
jgi:hypothetical protein